MRKKGLFAALANDAQTGANRLFHQMKLPGQGLNTVYLELSGGLS